jgi:adenylate cyclase, class 2
MADQEIEAKFYVRRLAEIEKRLQQLGANLIQPRTQETNWRFDTPQGDLRRDGRALRLRRDQGVHLTYKGQSENQSGALSRREIEFSASDLDSARKFLEALGYDVVFIYEKYRTTYSLSPRPTVISKSPKGHDIHFMLDELPYGNFVEIEGESDALEPAAMELGLAWKTAIPASYHVLFERLCETRTLSFRDLTFENFKTIQILPADLGVNPADE